MNIGNEWVGPAITGVFGLILGIVAAIMARRGQKLGAREQRAPDVQEMWAQQELDRRRRQIVEDLWWGVRSAFQSYYRRVTHAIVKLGIPEEKTTVFELTESELAAIEASVEEPTKA